MVLNNKGCIVMYNKPEIIITPTNYCKYLWIYQISKTPKYLKFSKQGQIWINNLPLRPRISILTFFHIKKYGLIGSSWNNSGYN